MAGPLIPLILGAGSAVASFGSQIWNNKQIQKQNADQRRYNEEMYERQRRDNESQWHQQNAYNDPTSQMQRLQEAGLNPNLVFGGGGVSQNAPQMQSVSPQGYSPNAPRIDAGSTLATYFDTRLKTAQYDNLKAQNTVLIQDAAQKAANTSKLLTGTARSQFDLEQAERLKDVSAEMASANLYKTQVQAQQMENEGNRRDMYADNANAKTFEDLILTRLSQSRTREEIKRLQKGNTMLDFDNVLKSQGLNPSDPTYMRVLTQMVNSFLDGTPFDVIKRNLKK